MSSVQATPRRRQSTNFSDPAANNVTNSSSNNLTSTSSNNPNPTNDDPLAQSLRQLSLSTGTPTKSKSPSPLSRTSTANGSSASAGGPRSPSVMSNANTNNTNNGRRNSMTPRSPLPNGRESRAGTPGLLRKASMNSLHSSSSINGGSPSKGLTRRTSAGNLKSPSPGTPLRSPMLGSGSGFEALREERQRPPRPPPPTAADIARSHFEAELARHSNTDEDLYHNAHTVVVLHDACYGHRFSRPRTSRANLSTIVERPERIQACAVGVSAAYVRLGGRHLDGGYMPHPQLDAASIPGNAVPFRIHKTARALPLQSPAVTNVHGTKWMEELKIMCDSAETKLALNGKELQRPDMDRGPPHHHATPARLHEGDLYLCSESLQALEGALGGVCEAVDAVFNPASQNRRSFVAIRPPGHHCSADWPSGFCWINNVHVGIMHAILAHGLTHAAIVDIDLHHGDGSQAIAWQHNARSASATKNTAAWKKTSIGYFSLHDINSFPCESGDEDKVKNASLCIENAHGQTVWNVHLEPWKTEAAFWALYASKYAALLEKLRAFFRNQATQRGDGSSDRSAIFISAGFDASEWESAGMQRHKVNVPTEFYARFTRDVVQIANEECAGRVISVLEGGYSDRALFSGVLSHVSGLAGSDPATTRDEAFQSGLGYEMGSRLGALGINGNASNMQEDVKPSINASGAPYDPAWWASPELDLIEAVIAPPPPPPEPKPDRTPHPATTYSSPTASSQAKIVHTPKLRRSMSGLNSAYGGGLGSSPSSRPPSPPPPPPPEVPWTTAMHELSKLLIPTADRTTTSCTVEDLSAEATRARRDRQILLGTIDVAVPAATSYSTPATPSGPTRVSMRERKQVKPFGSSVAAAASTAIKEEDPELDRKNRRKTVGGAVSATGTPVASGARGGRPKSSAGRRLSGASTAVPKDDFDLAPPVPAMPTVIPSAGPSSTGSSTRPTSAHSGSTTAAAGRPDSSMSAAAPPLSVRKARPTTATGKTPRKKAAAATTTSSSTSTTAPTKPTYSRKTSSSSAATTATASTAATNDDLDTLTSSMRKIKINVVTAAQKEAREKAKREKEAAAKAAGKTVSQTTSQTTSQTNSQTASRESSAEAAPVVSTPLPKRLVDTTTSTSTAAPSTPLAQTIGAAPTLRLTEAADPVGPSLLSVDTAMAASSIASDDHSPLLTPSTEGGLGSDVPSLGFPGVSTVPAPAPAPTVFIPYQPDSTPHSTPQQQQYPHQPSQRVPSLSSSSATAPPLHWLPPNEVNTPMPMQSVAMAATPSPMKRADLPVFTATSSIPFFGGSGAGSSSSRPSSAGLSAASASAASSRPATSSGAAPASPTMRPRSPTKLPRSPTKSPRKMQN